MSVNKVFVGVHGIGDQTEFETIQTIIERVTAYQGGALHVPLGKISSESIAHGFYECPDQAEPAKTVGFAEVYWADIPRKVVLQGYVLEETTRWAGTLVEKLDRQYGNPLAPADKESIATILPEAIESVRVLKRLSQLAEWGVKFKFDLKGLLDSYLGDVQFVTEFDHKRKEILERFIKTMSDIRQNDKEAEIFIIAHSEGTVVAFLGLLEALAARVEIKDGESQWIDQVKGFMTIGSPIDKHLILWPEMWKGLNRSWPADMNIVWYNYYDFGDPVGFSLDTARTWLGGNSPFRFTEEMDKGFARYLMPGKAHVDYWKDGAPFGDFFRNTGLARSPAAAAPPELRDRSLAGWFSCLLPYLLSFGLLWAGVFIFYNTIITCIAEDVGAITMLLDALAFSALVAGIGVAARIPRLVRDFRWHVVSLLMALLAFVFFWFTVDPDVCDWLIEPLGLKGLHSRMSVGFMALVILQLSYLYNFFSRRSGVWFMVAVGSAVAFSLILVNVIADADHLEILPVLIGGGAFLYLWWLSVLVFDLSFIWHQYIRNSLALRRMQDCYDNSYRQPFVSRGIGATEKYVASGVARGAEMVRNSVNRAMRIMPGGN